MTTKVKGKTHVITADDVTAGSVNFHFPNLQGPTGAIVQLRDVAGVEKATGAITVANGVVNVILGAGVATDILSVIGTS